MPSIKCVECGKMMDIEAMMADEKAKVDEQTIDDLRHIYEPKAGRFTLLFDCYCPHCGHMYYVHNIVETISIEVDDGDSIGYILYQEDI